VAAQLAASQEGLNSMESVNLEYTTALKCTVSTSIFSITSGGRNSISDHLQAKKRKNALPAKSQSGCMTNYFRKLELSKTEYDLAVYEGTYVCHTVLHNHSFRSMDCTTTLQMKFADKKFSCARTKCESIVTNVYAPWALEELKNDLKCVNFVTVSCDASNHKHVKQLPILVRCFQEYDMKTPVKNMLLTFVEISGETADIVFM
jgi:hypothetical protein